ncbi:CD1375 family protein [Veillonella caviae]|uniref:CD1375 family protein n=1 Tax=Veillonella caviae TaxID=248316 RepID=UPI0023A890D9|nr:CD1375 family protein [Veillonella caviae]MCI5708700.1 hypothetical protein [Veillonella caviae]MCI6406347.1 hypothetical protein [Veillonella caviae]MDD7291432.1 CD1375 family protein [Veillonella caviae]MDY5715989.1 CD1375 family protein [Veillonella caviae]MDY6225019.1 CD1375 family protein [Veillonella caviae]
MALFLKFMVPIYGRMVLSGKYTVDPTETGKQLVPEQYLDAVCAWCIEFTEKYNQKDLT